MLLPVFSAAVEGVVDEAVVPRLISHAGGETGTVYGRRGKPCLRQRIAGFNQAARHAPWVVLVDLDNDAGWWSRPGSAVRCPGMGEPCVGAYVTDVETTESIERRVAEESVCMK